MILGIVVGIVLAPFVVWSLIQIVKQNRKQERYWKQVQQDNDRWVQESRKRLEQIEQAGSLATRLPFFWPERP